MKAENKYAHVERERRYLICELPEDISGRADFLRMFDLYILGTRLRLRRIETQDGQVVGRKLGQKYLPQADRPDEAIMTNFYLDETEYEAFAVLEGSQITKRRYAFDYQRRHFSIDVFEDALKGLVLCETELLEVDEPVSNLPPFVSREVTSDTFFTGGSLIKISSAELAERLRDECST